MKTLDIKKTIQQSKVKQWQVAEIAGINEFTLSRLLRRPENIDPEKRKRIESAIIELIGGSTNGQNGTLTGSI